MALTHLSLFTGIGGLDLAAEWAGFTTVGQCEWADYQTKVLEKNWPGLHRWRDIHDLSADEFIRRTGRNRVTIISGGFPCQPHSLAGKRKASSDERDLWPEYRRIICEFKPRWVVAENVRGLLTSEDGRFFRGILRDFSNLGYHVGWGLWGACDVGAIHRRERIFVIAYSGSKRVLDKQLEVYSAKRDQTQHGIDGYNETPSDANSVGKQWNIKEKVQEFGKLSRQPYPGSIEEWQRRSNLYQPKLLRSYDGVPGGVDRVKCLGNSVVPQQAYPIFKAIAEIELGS